MKWTRKQPGLYEVWDPNGGRRAMVEIGRETGTWWWWAFGPEGGVRGLRYGHEFTLREAKAAAERAAK